MYNILSDIESYCNEEENHIMFNNERNRYQFMRLGKPGKGKRNIINCTKEKKIDLEGKGSNVTHKFIKYKILK